MLNKKNYTDLFSHLRDKKIFFRSLRRFLNNLFFFFLQEKAKKKNFKEIINEKKKSDIIFIFGSGGSINNLNKKDIKLIKEHNTLSFNWFIYQNILDIDFHVIRESVKYACTISDILKVSRHYAETVNSNKFFNETFFFIQDGIEATTGNCIVSFKMLDTKNILRFKTKSRSVYENPSLNFENGLVHGPGTLIDSINIAILGGWKKIVLVGVDLNNRQYFWLRNNQSNRIGDQIIGTNYPHTTLLNGISEFINNWNIFLKKKKSEIFIYRNTSYLKKYLKIYKNN